MPSYRGRKKQLNRMERDPRVVKSQKHPYSHYLGFHRNTELTAIIYKQRTWCSPMNVCLFSLCEPCLVDSMGHVLYPTDSYKLFSLSSIGFLLVLREGPMEAFNLREGSYFFTDQSEKTQNTNSSSCGDNSQRWCIFHSMLKKHRLLTSIRGSYNIQTFPVVIHLHEHHITKALQSL